MTQNAFIILSDDKSVSGRSKIPSKAVTSSNKASAFPAENKSGNEETPLKKTHQEAFTSKQENLERIKGLHIKIWKAHFFHNYKIREEERVCMDAIREEECAHMV